MTARSIHSLPDTAELRIKLSEEILSVLRPEGQRKAQAGPMGNASLLPKEDDTNRLLWLSVSRGPAAMATRALCRRSSSRMLSSETRPLGSTCTGKGDMAGCGVKRFLLAPWLAVWARLTWANERTNERMNEQPNEQTNDRTNK